MEHGLLGQAEGVVTVTVELAVREAAEVADSGQCQGDEAVQEFPHAVATQGNVCTNGHTFAQLELCDGLLSAGNNRLLTGDCGEIADCAVHELCVASCLADTHVYDDLNDLRGLHDVLVLELFLQSGNDDLSVLGLEAGGNLGFGH